METRALHFLYDHQGACARRSEPTDLPDGTEIELLPLDPGDWLDEADRAALHEALRQSDADVAETVRMDSALRFSTDSSRFWNANSSNANALSLRPRRA